MTRKTLIAVTAATAIGLGALTAGAGAWAKDRGDDRSDKMVNRVTEMLSLNEGQVEALKALTAEVKETRQLMHSQKGNFMGSMAEFINDETFDQQLALDTINQRLTALQTNAPDLVNAAAVFFDGLSAEQKAEIMEKMEKMQKRHGDRGGRH